MGSINLSNCILQKRSIYSNRTVSYMIVLLELLTVLLEYIDFSVIAAKDSYYYTNILPIMLALCSMLSGTYYAHNYASIIGGSLTIPPCKKSNTPCKTISCTRKRCVHRFHKAKSSWQLKEALISGMNVNTDN